MDKMIRLLYFLGPRERNELFCFGGLSLFSPAAELLRTVILIPILTQAFARQSDEELFTKVVLSGLILLLISGFDLVKVYVSTGLITNIAQDWTTKIYELYALEEVVDHNKRTADQAKTAARYDVAGASELITTTITLAVNFVTLAIHFCAMIYVARWVGAVGCAAVAAMIVVTYRYNRARTILYGAEKRRLDLKVNGILSTAYGAYKELKIDSRSGRLLERYKMAVADYTRVQRHYARMTGIQGAILGGVLEAGLVFLLALSLAAGMSLPSVLPGTVTFLVLFIRMIPIAKRIVTALTNLSFGFKSVDAVRNNLERYDRLKRAKTEREALRLKHVTLKEGIRMRGVTFRYPGGELILDQADMDVAAGESTAVVGCFGVGKTTVLDLLFGLLRPEAGHIWYDDFDIVTGMDGDGPCQADLGRLVSYIPQIVYLNNETVRNNVAFMAEKGKEDEDRIIDCLRHVHIWESVRQMKDGLDTLIGENGVSISGGQRQLIALARALYKEFEILVMDEATAALDVKTEKNVMDTIRGVTQGKALLIVTHHMALADACDHVYRLEDRKLRKVR